MMVSLVPAEHAEAMWPKVRPHLMKAAEYTFGRYEPEDMLTGVVEYGDSLWIAFEEEDVKGAVVTTFSTYPRKRYVNMIFCGGEELNRWKGPMLDILQKWAFDHGCDGIECSGRLGWERIFKEDGFKFLWQTFELPKADAGLDTGNG